MQLVWLLDVDGKVGDGLPAVLQHGLGLVIAHGLKSPDSLWLLPFPTTHGIDLGSGLRRGKQHVVVLVVGCLDLGHPKHT